MSHEEEKEIIEDLKASYSRHGPLHPVVRTQFGVAAGETRKKAVPEWKEVKKDVKDYLEHLKLKAADNIQALKPASWWGKLFEEAAKEYVKQGTPKEKVAEKMVEDFPASRWRILRYLPEEYKQPLKVEAGKKGGPEYRSLVTPSNQSKSSSVGEKEPKSGHSSRKDEYTPPTVKREYKGSSKRMSEETRKADTPEENLLQNFVQSLRVDGKKLNFEFQKPVEYEEGKAYTPDATLYDWLILEVEGEGSASAENPKRDETLKEQGKTVLHLANGMMKNPYYLDLLAQCVRVIVELGPPR